MRNGTRWPPKAFTTLMPQLQSPQGRSNCRVLRDLFIQVPRAAPMGFQGCYGRVVEQLRSFRARFEGFAVGFQEGGGGFLSPAKA